MQGSGIREISIHVIERRLFDQALNKAIVTVLMALCSVIHLYLNLIFFLQAYIVV